jgi:uncharacterized protein YjiK
VQSLSSNELINLDLEPDVAAIQPSPDTLPLSKVATEVMGVEGIRSDNFEERFAVAREKLELIQSQKGELTLDDYHHVSHIMDEVLLEETNDPVYKAYLDLQKKDEDQ